MRLVLLLLAALAAAAQGRFIQTGKEYVYSTEIRVAAGTMDHSPHLAGHVYRMKMRAQPVSDGVNVEISDFKMAEYVGPVNPQNMNTDLLEFASPELESMQFSVKHGGDGLFQSVTVQSGLDTNKKNILKGLASLFQHNNQHIGEGAFKSTEQTVHGLCDVSYVTTSGTVYKSINHMKDCKNPAAKIMDNIRGYQCDWHDADRQHVDGVVSTSNTAYNFEKEGDAHKITEIKSNGVVVSQMFETAGYSHIALVNHTSTLVQVKDSAGDLGASGETLNNLEYEFMDGEYQWNKDRDLKAAEPLFSSSKPDSFDQSTLKNQYMDMLNKQKDLMHTHTIDKDSIQKMHANGLNKMMQFLFKMNYDTLMSIFNTLSGDTSETGVMKRNLFTESLGSIGTTASAKVVMDLFTNKKFENDRDATRTMTSIPFHIRRPNTQLTNEFEALMSSADERFSEMALPLTFGHLVRMTCERAGKPFSAASTECFKTYANEKAQAMLAKYEATTDREEKNIWLSAIKNIRHGGIAKLLMPIIKGETKESDEMRTNAMWAAYADTFMTKDTINIFFPIFAEKKNSHDLRISAISGIMYAQPTSTDMARVLAVLKEETDYELINYVFTLMESFSNAINPCQQKTAEVAGFYLKYLKQFSQYETDWGFGVSKTYRREFQQKKYGYGGSYTYWTVGSHESTTPLSIGMSIASNIHENYEVHLFQVHLRLEGVAKGLIRKFKTSDPSKWKTADLKTILDGMGIKERPDQPVRATIKISFKGVDVIVRCYEEGATSEDGKIGSFFKNMQDLGSGYTINHLRALTAGTFIYEQPNEMGLPTVTAGTVNTMMAIKATVKRGSHRGLLFRDVTYDLHLMTQGSNIMMVQFPSKGKAVAVMQDRVYHAHFPRNIVVGVNPLKKEVKLSVSRATYDEPTMVMMHAQTSVFSKSGDSFKSKIVSLGEDATKERNIASHESDKFGYYAHAQYFDCELDISRSNAGGKLLKVFMPYNKNPKTPWTGITMGLRQLRAFFFYFPRAEKCGVMARWSGSKVNPVKQIEVVIKVSRESGDQRLFLRGASTKVRAVIKAKGDVTRAYRVSMSYDYTPGYMTNKIRLQLNRAEVSSMDIAPYTVCLGYDSTYPGFSEEQYDVKLNEDLSMSGKVLVQYGKGTSCGGGDDGKSGEIKINFKHSTTQEAREDLKKKWYYKQCMDLKNSPAMKGRSALPVSEACYMTAFDASNARKYTYDIQFTKLTDRAKRIISTARSVVRAGLLPYLNVDSDEEFDDAAEIGPFMNLEVVLHDDDKLADVNIETVHGTKNVKDYPVKLNWGNRLRNLKFTKTLGRLMKMKIISPCVGTVDHIRTMDNVTYSYEAASCWTLFSAHCGPTPSYAVFTKNTGGKVPLAMKAFIGGHEVEIEPQSNSVKINGNSVTLSGTEEHIHKIGSKEIFQIMKWGSTYNIYSFLKVWVAFDGNFVKVVPAPSVRGQHCGMCGNFNRNKFDELTGKDGALVKSSSAMSDSWQWKC